VKHFSIRHVLLIGLIWFTVIGWLQFLSGERQAITITGDKENLIRLHILANSDDPADQRLKLQVRDAVVAYLTPHLSKFADSNSARIFIASRQQEIINLATEILKQNGASYPVTLQLGMFDFPVKLYGDMVFPAGRYEAVRLVIGQGAGKNWWCVLFPPLCFIDGTNAVASGAGQEVTEQPQKPVQIEFRSKLWEWIRDR